MTRLLCTFRPQAWINDYAVSVDPEGPTTWETDWTEETRSALTPWAKGDLPEEHSEESDNLRFTDGAPEWTREWTGPFEVEYEVIERG